MKALTVRELREYRSLAERNAGKKGSEAILRLVSEVERLRAIKQHSNGAITEDTLFPWGKHKGTPLHAVPRDYLRWWFNQINPASLRIDADLGQFPAKAVALKKLKLFDYLSESFAPDVSTSIK